MRRKEKMDNTLQKFKKGIKKGGILKNENGKNVKICDISFEMEKDKCYLFGEALYLGHLDACRTIHIEENMKNKIKDQLYGATDNEGVPFLLKSYFDKAVPSDSNSFDCFHEKLCIKLTDKFKGYNIDLKYGQAQKIVNMAFKYLYCCKDIKENYNYFKYCHMPLDKFTLLWFGKISGIYIFTWSSMNVELYKKVEKSIRSYINKKYSNQRTVLDEEFDVWEEMKGKTFDLSYNRSNDKQREIIKKINEIKD